MLSEHIMNIGYGYLVFAVACLLLLVTKYTVHILAIIQGYYKFHKKQPISGRTAPYPGVSIIKPLTGFDQNLYNNLESFYTMDYPIYEILFCFEDETDSAITTVTELNEKYPSIDTTIFVGASNVGVNPKINNIYKAYESTKYELILSSDSNITMKPDTLENMINNLTDNVALVHQMPFTYDREGFPALYEQIYFGTIFSHYYLVADCLGIILHTGMSFVFRKKVLEEVGGLIKFSPYLAEDYIIARAFVAKGWKIKISNQPALQNSGNPDIRLFQKRLIRWAQLRYAQVPIITLMELYCECFVGGMFGGWAVKTLFDWNGLAFYLIHILVWFMLDFLLISIVRETKNGLKKIEFFFGWIFQETCGPIIMIRALFFRKVQWRSRYFKLFWGGTANQIDMIFEDKIESII